MVRIAQLLAVLAAVAPAIAHPANGPRNHQFGCGTDPSPEFLAATAEMAVQEAAGKFSAPDLSAQAVITIQTYFHVVAKSKTLAGGYVPKSQLDQQIAVMNSNYAPYGIQFNLVSTDYTVNTQWATDQAELTMKKALRKGDYKALNVYFQFDIGGNLGYCYFPTNAAAGSETFYLDGCAILYSSTPGGTSTNFNQGKTVTHEVGHWFGLLHTFQGGCTGSGDSIADTPAQSSPTSGCPTGRDSCPSAAGLDPIHNYMDYSYDSCYEEFTPQQKTRMLSMYNTYRA